MARGIKTPEGLRLLGIVFEVEKQILKDKKISVQKRLETREKLEQLCSFFSNEMDKIFNKDNK